MIIIIVLKPNSRVNQGKSHIRGQNMDKNYYYHSFKTWLGSRLETRFKSWVGRSTCQVDPDFITRIIIILIISTLNIN